MAAASSAIAWTRDVPTRATTASGAVSSSLSVAMVGMPAISAYLPLTGTISPSYRCAAQFCWTTCPANERGLAPTTAIESGRSVAVIRSCVLAVASIQQGWSVRMHVGQRQSVRRRTDDATLCVLARGSGSVRMGRSPSLGVS